MFLLMLKLLLLHLFNSLLEMLQRSRTYVLGHRLQQLKPQKRDISKGLTESKAKIVEAVKLHVVAAVAAETELPADGDATV